MSTKKRAKTTTEKEVTKPKKKKSKKKVKEDMDHLVGTFTDEYKELKAMMGSKTTDLQSDKATEALLRTSMASLLKIIPVVEESVLKDPKQNTIYAYNSLLSQIREVANDLRSVTDLDQQAQYITDVIMTNIFKLLAQNISMELFTIRTGVSGVLEQSPKRRKEIMAIIEKSILRQGLYISEIGGKVSKDVRDYLVG